MIICHMNHQCATLLKQTRFSQKWLHHQTIETPGFYFNFFSGVHNNFKRVKLAVVLVVDIKCIAGRDILRAHVIHRSKHIEYKWCDIESIALNKRQMIFLIISDFDILLEAALTQAFFKVPAKNPTCVCHRFDAIIDFEQAPKKAR